MSLIYEITQLNYIHTYIHTYNTYIHTYIYVYVQMRPENAAELDVLC